MNEWSIPDYAIAVREALDGWVTSVWNYTNSYDNTTQTISFLFYMSNINSTDNYDVFITFIQNEVSPGSNTVGLTTLKWNPITHQPFRPIKVEITTYSKKASLLFVRNVAMHELGHVLGLGHALSSETSNGPELMYYTSYNNQIIYPSTLDVYGITILYQGYFNQIVQLPSNIPYKILEGGTIPTLIQTSPYDILYPTVSEFQIILNNPQEIHQTLIFFIPFILWMALALFIGLILCSSIKSTLLTIAIAVSIAYYTEVWDTSLISLTLKIVPLLPAITIGAYLGESLHRKIVKKQEKDLNEISQIQSEYDSVQL